MDGRVTRDLDSVHTQNSGLSFPGSLLKFSWLWMPSLCPLFDQAKKYCKFCVFPLRLLASTWHLWSAYRIKPWKAGKLPSVSSLLEISAHLLNLAAFIYSPESSASCWFWLLHSCQLLSAEEVGLLGGHSSIPEMWSHHWRLHFELTAPLLGQRCTSQMFILVNACQLLLKFR